jgi:cystathionine beta-synthase
LQDPQILDKTVGEIMGPPLPSVGSGETVDVALRRLEESPAVIVLDNGHPVGIITRSDALAFLAQAGSPREAR